MLLMRAATTAATSVTRRRGGVSWRAAGGRHYVASAAPDFGVVFDIDGVLIRGGKPLPGACEILQSLRARGVPHMFLTNNGGTMEDVKAKQMSEVLGMEIDPALVVMSHTPMQDLVATYGDRRVLVMGSFDIQNVARQYGFRKIVTAEDLAHHYPGQYAFRQYQQRTAPYDGEPIEAIIVMHDPLDWSLEMQIAVDVLMGGDPPGSGRADGSQTPLFISNDDFVFSSSYPHPRFAMGAFTMCLKTLYKARTGNELEVALYGKPQRLAYTYAEKILHNASERDASNPLKTIYMIGDNPHSDIQGANNAGTHWSSILVLTGVYDGVSDPEHHPDVHAPTVREAIEHIYQAHSLAPV